MEHVQVKQNGILSPALISQYGSTCICFSGEEFFYLCVFTGCPPVRGCCVSMPSWHWDDFLCEGLRKAVPRHR